MRAALLRVYRQVHGLDATAAQTFGTLWTMLERLGVELVITHLENPEMERLLRAHGVIGTSTCMCALATPPHPHLTVTHNDSPLARPAPHLTPVIIRAELASRMHVSTCPKGHAKSSPALDNFSSSGVSESEAACGILRSWNSAQAQVSQWLALRNPERGAPVGCIPAGELHVSGC